MRRNRIILLVTLSIIATSCRTTHNVVHDTIYRSNVEYVDRIQYDSIYVRDSIYVYKTGDTIYCDRWHNNDRLVVRHDSVEIHDTVYIRNEESSVEVKEERKNLSFPPFAFTCGLVYVLIVLFLCNTIKSAFCKKK